MNQEPYLSPETSDEPERHPHRRYQVLAAMGIPMFTPRREQSLATTLNVQAKRQQQSGADQLVETLNEVVEKPQLKSTFKAASDAQPAGDTDPHREHMPWHRDRSHDDSTSIPSQKSPDWRSLESAIQACQACDLYRTRLNPVLGFGDSNAEWMIIGGAPNAEDESEARPYAGDKGELVAAMFKPLGLSAEQGLYYTPIIKSRPPSDRDPLSSELSACHDYLEQQIKLIDPRIIIIVGRTAAHHLLASKQSMNQLRGQVHTLSFAKRQIPAIVTYDPSYLMRANSQKSKAWDDIRLAWHTYQALKK